MSESKKQNHDRSALNEVKRTRGRPRLPDSERKAHVTICLPPNVVKLVKSLSERSGMGFSPVISQALSEHFASELEQEASSQEQTVTEQTRKGRPPLPVDVRKVQHNMLWPPALLARIKAKALERKVPASTIVIEVMSDYFKKIDLFNGEKITITEQDVLECNAWDPWGDTQD